MGVHMLCAAFLLKGSSCAQSCATNHHGYVVVARALCFVCGEMGHISAQCTKGEDPFLEHATEMDNRKNSSTNDSHPESDDAWKHMTVGSSSHLHGQAEVQSYVAN